VAEPDNTAILTGATSLVGYFLLPRLVAGGYAVEALTRRPPSVPMPGVRWHAADLHGPLSGIALPPARVAVHVAPLWLLPARLDDLAAGGVRRLIAFGSTSRYTKEGSGSRAERALAARLAEAEDAVTAGCRARGIRWTLFRPTMIYGEGRDKNVAAIARFISRVGFFPLAGEGVGRRQPVHAEDLAAACVQALDCPAALDRAYNLSGGSTLSYAEMVAQVFRGLGRRPRLLRVPVRLVRGALAAAALLPAGRGLSPEMADRMNRDLCFDHGEAARDFGYRPRPFLAEPGAAAANRQGL
jgi:nucleoside-diphosphate-sugar epimerase